MAVVVTLQIQAYSVGDVLVSTMDLDDGVNTMLLEYTPLSPTTTTSAYDPGPLGDGGEIMGLGYRNVVEPMRVLVMGANAAALRATIHAIELGLESARRHSRTGLYPRVYANFVPEGTAAGGTALRSELLDGVLTMGPTAIDMWGRAKVEVMISWTRRFYWEGAEIQQPLDGYSVTNSLSAVQINTVNDGLRSNYVIVNTSTVPVKGNLQAPVRLELTHTTNDAYKINTIYVGSSSYAIAISPYNFTIEGEAATSGGTTLPATLDTIGYSNGQYQQNSATINSIEQQMFEWSLPQGLLNITHGQYLRLLTRFAVQPVGTEYVRFRLWFQGTSMLWEGPLVQLKAGMSLQDLGAVQLPPWLVDLENLYPLTLRMYMTVAGTSGTQTISVDAINLIPTFNWRKYTPLGGYGLPYNITLKDDGIRGYLFQDGWGSPGGRTGYYSALGSPLVLDPSAATQMFYFGFDTDIGRSEPGRLATVKLFYRPRYKTV